MARVHRIGQTKVVHVYRLVTAGTIEERISQHAEQKLYLSQMVNRDLLSSDAALSGAASSGSDDGADEDADNEEEERPSKHDMLASLVFGADRIFRSETGKGPTDAELDAMLDRSLSTEQRTAALQVRSTVSLPSH